jgi:hypothetical protein
MKLTFWILALALSLQVSTSAFANNSDYDQHQEVESEFEAWCAQGTRTLERARVQASGQIAYGQFGAAAQTLINALKNGVTRPNWSVKPVTWRLMNHATNLGEAMIRTVGTDTRGLKATVNAMEGMYDLIIQSANEIDRRYYFTRCGFCRGQRVRDFEDRMLRMASDMLTLVNSNMAYVRAGQVFPFGPSRSYLVASEVITGAAFGEIAELLRAESHACELVELRDLNLELASFNRSSPSEFDRVGMFQETHYRIQGVINELRSGRGCR